MGARGSGSAREWERAGVGARGSGSARECAGVRAVSLGAEPGLTAIAQARYTLRP
jgi:hypothetical protein